MKETEGISVVGRKKEGHLYRMDVLAIEESVISHYGSIYISVNARKV